jgi:hypothetical protein
MDTYLKKIYYNPKSTSWLAGSTTLFRQAKKKFPNVKLKQIENFLQKQLTNNVFSERNVRAQQIHPKFVSTKPFNDVQADLAFFKHHHNVFCVAIDLFSGFKLAVYMGHSKSSSNTSRAVERLLDSIPGNYVPSRLSTDKGREWQGLASMLAKRNIKHIYLNSFLKANQAEMAIRQIRQLFKKYNFKYGKKMTPKVMQNIISILNRRHNRSLGMSAIEAIQPLNVARVFERKYGAYLKARNDNAYLGDKPKYKKNQLVRILAYKSIVDKVNPMQKGKLRYSAGKRFRIYKPISSTYPIHYLLYDEITKALINKRFPESHLISISEQEK